MLANWVYQTTTTTGTGDLTLATVTNYSTFADQFAIGQPFYYEILKSDGTPVEVGIGKLSDSTTLQRIAIIQTMVSGVLTSVSPTAVNLGAGTYKVVCAIPANAGIVNAVPAAISNAAHRGCTPYPYINVANTKGLTANVMLVLGCRVEAGKGISGLGVQVTTAGGTSTDKVRLGFYPVLPDGSAGPLVMESGDLRTDTTGVKTASPVGNKSQIPPGWYYLGVVSSVAVTLRAANTTLAQTGPLGVTDPGQPNVYATCSAMTGGWTSLPSTMPTVTSVSPGQFAPLPIIYY
jgi:hypothetical protein